MHPQLNYMVVQQHNAELRREAVRAARGDAVHERRYISASQPSEIERCVTLRFGTPADRRPLAGLAELDSSAPLTEPVLVAEVDGRLRAALALAGGNVAADPFYPTADLIALLRARARQLEAARGVVGHLRRLRSWARLPALS
jgi:hypothetical protein